MYVNALMDHPKNLPKHGKRKSIQALINYMDRNHSQQFAEVYAELCEITHYGSYAMWASFSSRDDLGPFGGFSWSSAPAWKGERQGLVACAQTLEVAKAMESALHNLGATCLRGLNPPKNLDDAPKRA